MNAQEKINIVWLRRDLRLDDNHALFKALEETGKVLLVFIFDPEILAKLPRHDKRISLIYKRLETFKSQLCAMGGDLCVLHAPVLEAWQSLHAQYAISKIFANQDDEPYALHRDQAVAKWAESLGMACHFVKDVGIFERTEIIKADGTPYTVFTPYSRAWKAKYVHAQHAKAYPCENLADKILPQTASEMPSIQSLGFDKVDFLMPSESYDFSQYEAMRNNLAGETTRWSIALRFGFWSVRKALRLGGHVDGFVNEIIWRDFFRMLLFHFPHVVHEPFKEKFKHIPWRESPADFERWKNGETGYPLIDAAMNELNTTGFMHNRARMVVASFLCKHLLLDYRLGEAYFAEKLLDFDLSANNGNWQWSSGTGCDAAPFFRIFNPSLQSAKFDSQGLYTKKWLPKDYNVFPIIAHETARQRALAFMKTGSACG